MSAGTATAAEASVAARAAPAAALDGSGIGFNGVTVAYKGAVALADLTLAIEPGEITAIIGPSGCGKTTALRAVAGFVRPVKGRIHIGERDVTDLPPHARDIGMVVQNYALFPHMRVDENVAFGLRARRAARAVIEERVRDCLRLVGMTEYAQPPTTLRRPTATHRDRARLGDTSARAIAGRTAVSARRTDPPLDARRTGAAAS